MAKNLKLKIKNTQIAQAVNLGNLKKKLAKRKADDNDAPQKEDEQLKNAKRTTDKPEETLAPKAEAGGEGAEGQTPEPKRVKARSHSRFSEPSESDEASMEGAEGQEDETVIAEPEELPEENLVEEETLEIQADTAPVPEAIQPEPEQEPEPVEAAPTPVEPIPEPVRQEAPKAETPKPASFTPPPRPPKVKLGPTGRHINDILPRRYQKDAKPEPAAATKTEATPAPKKGEKGDKGVEKRRPPAPGFKESSAPAADADSSDNGDDSKAKKSKGRLKEYRDVKPTRKGADSKGFDSRDRLGLRDEGERSNWRKKRANKQSLRPTEDLTIRPTELSVRLPIAIKDLAAEMKLKASQLISKLFMQGVVVTLNDFLTDETTIQLLGDEFGCAIKIDTSEEERIRITDKSIREEIQGSDPDKLALRPPVVAFMGHVDHGKTSLIDKIRSSNRAAGEAGAITQHIGAFLCHTSAGDITVLDTPGHEAFSAMRARGAEVTDIVVLVVAGDEGIRQQTTEAIQHAKAAGVTLIVAINKCDKPAFDADNVYRQLAEQELLPEAWGGQIITVNCSALTGQGVDTLLEMLALQAEVLELRADASQRARGSVLESEMHKGLGLMATVLVQNGSLHPGDSIVFEKTWGRVKTMKDEHGRNLTSAGPSHAVEITGLDSLPAAGEEFIVVANEKEARDIAEVRQEEHRQTRLALQKRPMSVEHLLQQATDEQKKVLNVILRADVQGSLEALKSGLTKIESDKVSVNIIFAGVGEVSESDVQLAVASKAVIVGFHTQVESHAEQLIKQTGVQVQIFDVIYHAINAVKGMLADLLDKIAVEEERALVEVRATFKSSQHGVIAGCYVKDGSVHRNYLVRVMRGGEQVWRGPIASLKRHKDDVKEVNKGYECGILLRDFQAFQEGDELQVFEITYKDQQL